MEGVHEKTLYGTHKGTCPSPPLPPLPPLPPTHTQAETHHESRVGAAAIEGASRADMLIPTRIELSKNFSIISVEDIPLVANLEQAQPLLHYP